MCLFMRMLKFKDRKMNVFFHILISSKHMINGKQNQLTPSYYACAHLRVQQKPPCMFITLLVTATYLYAI